MPAADLKAELARERSLFRARLEAAGATAVWPAFAGRIALVLSGGGARGAYEAGALLAFQDARLPTHIIAATSIGAINAASYAAHSETLAGNAESLVESWSDLTPPAVGIEWTRYAWVLAGLIAASAGFGNLLRHWFIQGGFTLELHDPALTWFALGLAGLAVLLLYDRLPYLGYIVRNFFRRTSWRPDRAKALASLAANAVVWGFVLLVIHSLYLPELIARHRRGAAAIAAALFLLLLLRRPLRAPLSTWLHRWLRLPLRPGLFANFERARLLRQRISAEHLAASPIRLVFTATDLESGSARFFSNARPEALAADPGVDVRFVAEEVSYPDDLIRAVIASSALPIVYEPIRLGERLYADGGMVANQPIRPAIRLGADVLFLVMMDPPERALGPVETFVDIGLRALDVLMLHNLVTDLRLLTHINTACERAAAELGLGPEQVEVEFGTRRYRYVRPFPIHPAAPLPGTVLDFDARTTGPALLAGYRDACRQVEAFCDYARQTRYDRPRRRLRLAPETAPA